MKARIKLADGMTFVAESGSGHAVVVDAAPDVGGRNLGARPMELVLMGTGACTAIDVMHILRKARQPVTDCVVEVEAELCRTCDLILPVCVSTLEQSPSRGQR